MIASFSIALAAVAASSTLAVPTTAAVAGKEQSVDTRRGVELRIQAAMIYNVIRFVEWPDHSLEDGGVDVCLAEADEIDAGLRQLDQKPVASGSVRYHGATWEDDAVVCDVLYLPTADTDDMPGPIDGLMTISTQNGFAKGGGILELVRRGDKVRFKVNRGAATEASLTFSSKLLQLADEVIK